MDRLDLDALLRRVTPSITRQLARYPLDRADREDVLQSTLLRVAERIGEFRGDARLSTWIFRVTANEALMMMRTNRRRASRLAPEADLEALAEAPATDALFCRARRDARLRAVLGRLAPEHRRVLDLHYADDLELAEIARRIGSTPTAVRSRLHRARASLRARLAKDAPISRADLAA